MEQSNNKNIGNDHGLKCVLITRYAAMGNVVMTIPVVYSACKCYPDIRFVIVTKPSLSDVFINHPDNLTVEGIDVHDHFSGFNGTRKLYNYLHDKYDFDGYIDLQNDSSTLFFSLLCKMHGVKTARFNRAMHNKAELTRKTNKVMLPLVSSRARYRETFFNLGLPLEECFGGLYSDHKSYGEASKGATPIPAQGSVGKAPAAYFASITTDTKAADEWWIGIAPFAAHPEKEYPLDKMEEVIRMLIDHHRCQIFIFGGVGRERDQALQWAEKYPQVRSLAGNRYGFPSELALLSNLNAMLTMDSANMHLAAIVGTPTVSVWGATHHYCGFKGWHQSENDMVQVPLSCRPCSVKGDRDCYRHDYLCLTAIRPESIYKKLLEKLNNNV